LESPRILLDLFVIFVAAKIAGEIFYHLRQPAVVGEILVGMLLGPHLLGAFQDTPALEVFAEIGVIFLLFAVGLETRASDMFRVGKSAAAVAVLGVILPFALGLALMLGLGQHPITALFVATALVATSVGITARVLADLGQAASRSARVILGAAIIDDILGLIVLAVVSGLAAGHFSLLQVILILLQALAFTGFLLFVGRRAAHRISAHLYRLHLVNPAFIISVALCLGLSVLAGYIGLAAIVGAFLAGMVFAETQEAAHIRRSLDPIYALFVPIFFVIMGAKIDLPGLLKPEVLGLGLLITLIAVVGKLFGCGLAARLTGLSKRESLAVGIGMSPRGEVGIVVAAIALSSGVISGNIYSVVMFMVVLTTLITPPLLRQVMKKLPSQET
jgi:Kef-type K+ transport system membrane component KefB